MKEFPRDKRVKVFYECKKEKLTTVRSLGLRVINTVSVNKWTS